MNQLLPIFHPLLYIYIVICRQTLSLYYNSSVRLDMSDTPSQDRNQPNFMSGWWHTPKPSLWLNVSSGINAYISNFICLHFCTIGYWSALFVRRVLVYASSNHYIPLPVCSKLREGECVYIYIYIYTHTHSPSPSFELSGEGMYIYIYIYIK